MNIKILALTKLILLMQWTIVLAQDATTTSSTTSPDELTIPTNKTKRNTPQLLLPVHQYAPQYAASQNNVQSAHKVPAVHPVMETHANDVPKPFVYTTNTIYQVKPNLNIPGPMPNKHHTYGFKPLPPGVRPPPVLPPSIVTPVTQSPLRPLPIYPPYKPNRTLNLRPVKIPAHIQQGIQSAAITQYPGQIQLMNYGNPENYNGQQVTQVTRPQYAAPSTGMNQNYEVFVPETLPKPEFQLQSYTNAKYPIYGGGETLPKPAPLVQNHEQFKIIVDPLKTYNPSAVQPTYQYIYPTTSSSAQALPKPEALLQSQPQQPLIQTHHIKSPPTNANSFENFATTFGLKSTNSPNSEEFKFESNFYDPQIFKNPVVPQLQHYLPQVQYKYVYPSEEMRYIARSKPSSAEENDSDDDMDVKRVLKEERKATLEVKGDGVDNEKDFNEGYNNADKDYREYDNGHDDHDNNKYRDDNDFKPSKLYPLHEEESEGDSREKSYGDYYYRDNPAAYQYDRNYGTGDDYKAKHFEYSKPDDIEEYTSSSHHKAVEKERPRGNKDTVKDSYGNYKQHSSVPRSHRHPSHSHSNNKAGKQQETKLVEKHQRPQQQTNRNGSSSPSDAPKIKKIYQENWYMTKRTEN